MSELRSAPPVAPARPRHVAALDVVRGAAITGVLLFHTGHLPGGFLGVDLFFVLSGHLITDLLLREAAATGRVSLAAFWGRRIRRLLPALAVMLAVVTAVTWAVAPPGLVRTTLADLPWAQLQLFNWHLIAESSDYWDRFGQDRVFEHLWSIAVEEQFYLVWPALVAVFALGWRRVDRPVAAAAGLVSVFSVLFMALGADPSRVYMGTDTRAFSLLLGALVAAPAVRRGLVRACGRRPGAAAALAASGIGAMWLLVDGTGGPWLFDGGLFAHALLSAVLIALLASAPDAGWPRALAARPLRWLGLVSYSLYLWHWPVIVLLSPEATGFGRWSWTALVCAVSIALAAVSKYLVEDPIRYRAGWARGRRGALALTAAMVALALLWTLLPEPAPPVVDVGGL
ncbi:acyltransferase [Glycomyces sp. A-F 0318]|uniref:acyltransferase family protein n=1 Tax=Glycomyces amatae TaxID=2881355 RepID=UPI001E541166|nr:acyltransferase [Glycomyces amatae]MCD0443052.1 acyltransferase [Glycomyces amatae]